MSWTEDYVKELAGENSLTLPVFWQTERRGRDRAGKPEYKVKLSVSFCFSNTVQIIEQDRKHLIALPVLSKCHTCGSDLDTLCHSLTRYP